MPLKKISERPHEKILGQTIGNYTITCNGQNISDPASLAGFSASKVLSKHQYRKMKAYMKEKSASFPEPHTFNNDKTTHKQTILYHPQAGHPILATHHLQLGEGDYGAVYWGVDLTTHEQLAVKECKISPGDVPTLEFKTDCLKKIIHPKAFCTETRTNRFIVTPLAFGQTLKSLNEHINHAPEHIEKILLILEKLILEIQTLHNKGYLHRDIAGKNIIWDEKESTITLVDFGFTVEHDASGNFQDTRPRSTPLYLAPECYQDYRYSIKSDLYAAGLVLANLIVENNKESDEKQDTLYKQRLAIIPNARTLPSRILFPKVDIKNHIITPSMPDIFNPSLAKDTLTQHILHQLVCGMMQDTLEARFDYDEIFAYIQFAKQTIAWSLNKKTFNEYELERLQTYQTSCQPLSKLIASICHYHKKSTSSNKIISIPPSFLSYFPHLLDSTYQLLFGAVQPTHQQKHGTPKEKSDKIMRS